MRAPLFDAFFIGGFACTTPGAPAASSEHPARHATRDYRRLRERGFSTARDGVQWRRVDLGMHRYDFSSVLPVLRAAREAGVQVIWDLCHLSAPEDVDVFSPAFVDRFAAYARAFALLHAAECDAPLHVAPIAEIAPWAQAGAETGRIAPATHGRGFELACQLVRATLAARDAILTVKARARFHQIEPAFGPPAEASVSAYEVFDLLCGRRWPQLGGEETALDVIGLTHHAARGRIDDADGLEHALVEAHARHARPTYVAATSAAGADRGPWLAAVGAGVRRAIERGVPVEGVCWCPIVGTGDRTLWGDADGAGERTASPELLDRFERERNALVVGERKVA